MIVPLARVRVSKVARHQGSVLLRWERKGALPSDFAQLPHSQASELS